MEVSRSSTARNGVVAAGSVWESRMKSDEVKGGIKVFNGEEASESENNSSTNNNADNNKRQRPKQSPTPSVVGVNGKRKTWKSDNSEKPIQIARQRSEQSKNLGDQLKELSVSADGIKKSPVLQSRKTRSEAGNERSPVQRTKNRSEEIKELSVSVDRVERNPIQTRNSIQLRKVKSDSNKGLAESVDVNERNSVPLTKSKSLSNKVLDEPVKNLDVTESNSIEAKEELEESVEVIEKSPVGVIEKSPVGDEKVRSDETCKEFDLCEEKVISSTSLSNLGQVKSAPQLVVADDDDDGDGDDGGGGGGDGDGDEDNWDEELDEELVDEEIEIEIEKKSVDVKEISIPEQKPKQVVKEEKKKQLVQENPPPISPIVKEISIPEQKPKQVVKEEKKINQVQDKALPISPIVKKQAPPIVHHSRTHSIPTKTKATPVSDGFFETHTEFQRIPETQSKLQSLVELVMWRDVSKSAFVFGLGTFMIISSSYTKDLNISLITVVSYLGLVYLAVIFLFRSIIRRGVVDVDDDTSQCYVVGEEEAVWLIKMVLPYLNEFLLKLRALFSGDPATTMKLAVLLFVLARGGSSITIWKMAKLGFFGVFTVPKIFTSYSPQLTAYGKFWVRRFKDAWESCSHKKAVAFGIFTLVWNLSSVVARIWAVFMLFVAFRYYQQSIMSDGDWVVEEEANCETSSWQGQIGGGHRRVRGYPTVVLEKTRKEKEKEKKRF